MQFALSLLAFSAFITFAALSVGAYLCLRDGDIGSAEQEAKAATYLTYYITILHGIILILVL